MEELNTIKPIKYFTGLKILSVCKTNIQAIQGLKTLKSLEELYLTENHLEEIKGLGGLVSLKKINLSCNKIREIQGLEKLFRLELVWINENLIQNIKGLESLSNLKELSLARNQIQTIGNGLDSLSSLVMLNLAGNPISTFSEIYKLKYLPSLKILSLSDPNYGESTVCSLSNYQTFMLYFLTNLTQLDCIYITAEARAASESLFQKKKLYYAMRSKSIRRSIVSTIKIITTEAIQKQTLRWDLILKLLKTAKTIEREIDEKFYPKPIKTLEILFDNLERSTLDSMLQGSYLDMTHSSIINKIKEEYQKICSYNRIFSCLVNKIESWGTGVVRELDTEFNSGGNLRYEEGCPNDTWYKSCCDLVLSRQSTVMNINVTRVVRIHNKLLRSRFEEKLETLADTSENFYKRNIDYLFYSSDNLSQICVEGFKSPSEYSGMGLPCCIPLCYSLETAETERLRTLYEDYDDVDEIYWPKGTTLLCKVYFGKGKGDLRVPYYQSDMTPKEIWELCPFNPPSICWAVYRTYEYDIKQRVWFIFENALILPEYFIEFEYSQETVLTNRHQLEPALESLSKPVNAFFYEKIPPEAKAEDVVEVPARKLISAITPDNVDWVIKGHNKDYLNLFNYQIESINWIEKKINITILILSCNQIEAIDFISYLINLVKLDLSFNCIKNLNGIENLSSLNELDLHNNKISSLSEIKKVPGSVLKFTCFNNDVYWDIRYQEVILSLIPGLNLLDWKNISKVLRKTICQEVTPEVLQINMKLFNQINCNSKELFEKIEVIELESINLTTMKGVSQCKFLKKLNLSRNLIDKIDYIQNSEVLDHLNLSGNFISEIAGLGSNKKLKTLELSDNKITKIEGIKHLELLTHLSIENNLLIAIGETKDIESITELYLSNNFINDMKEIFLLKRLFNLIVLDILGNPCCELPRSRLQIIYQLPFIKILNGTNVDAADQTSAKSEFGGVLTEELLERRCIGVKTTELRQLDLSCSKLKSTENMFTSDLFPKLLELNVSNNLFTNLVMLGYLPMLAKLDISYNRIESFQSGPKGFVALPNIEILNISNNMVTNFLGLQQAQLRNLRILNISHNLIAKIDYIECLPSLREIDFSYNKIRNIDKRLELPNIRSVNFDNNGLKHLNFLENLLWIQAIKASCNRILDLADIEKIQTLPNLLELILISNPIERKIGYRNGIIKKIPNLLFLDGKEVTLEEKGESSDFKRPQVNTGFGRFSTKVASITLDAYFLKIQPRTAGHQSTRKS